MAEFTNIKLDNAIGTFICGGKGVEITINETSIKWTFNNSETDKKLQAKNRSVEWQDVIGLGKKTDASKCLTLSYIDKKPNHKWKCQHITFEGDFTSWIKVLQERSQKGKAKRLLVIINPIGGTGRARQTYEKKVAPLFSLAGIAVDVIVTERASHAVDIAKTHDLSNFDGLVVVGGDGSYHEVLNGLLIRTQEENNIDYNNCEIELKSPTIPIGIIPAGTGNGVASWCCGTNDVETSTLHIIRGEQHKSSVQSLSVGGKHVIFCGLLLSYGIMSDIIKIAESRRWMKVVRYPVSVIGGLMGRNRVFKGEVTYKTNSTEDKEGGADNVESDWKKLDLEEFVAVSTFSGDIDIKSDKLRFSLQQPTSHFMAYPRVPKMEHLKFWGRLATQSSDVTDFDWLKFKQQITRFHIKVDRREEGRSNYTQADRDLELFVNVDGESLAISEPELDVRFCPHLVPLYCQSFAF